MRLKIGELLEATKGELISGSRDEQITGISIDTRTTREGEGFVAIKGEQFDGHNFLKEAVAKGSSCLIVSNSQLAIFPSLQLATRNSQLAILKIDNTLKALGDIARYWRGKFRIPIIAITGSNGKTTTKEMLSSILSTRFKVLKTKGNLNNQIGLPLTIFDLCPEDEVAVLEMATNHFGEIRYLAEIARPEFGIITNIGQAHLECFKDTKGVARAKGELLREVETAILPQETPYFDQLKKECREAKVFTFGFAESIADIKATDIKEKGFLGTSFRLKRKGCPPSSPVQLSLIGRANVLNALAASQAAYLLGLGEEEIRKGLSQIQLPSWRMDSFEIRGARIISDCYNANPSSMLEAIKTLESLPGERRILIMGNMEELGEKEGELHQEIGEKIVRSKVDILLTVGELAAKAAEEAARKKEVYPCADNREAAKKLSELIKKEDVVLIKGSRKMRMEEIGEELRIRD